MADSWSTTEQRLNVFGDNVVAQISDNLPTLRLCKRFECGEGDVVVHAPGFEDRTTAILEVLAEGDGKAKGVLLDYLPRDPRNRMRDVRDGLVSRRVSISDEDILGYNRFDPGDFETRLLGRLDGYRAQRVVVDVSSMSKLAIMLVLNVCFKLDVALSVVYAEAGTYGPNEEEFTEAKQDGRVHQPSVGIYTGVHGVVRVDSLASVAMQGQPTAAIVFMSFNDALTQVLLNTVYPSRLILINSRPPAHRWREQATAWIHEQVRREWEDDNPLQSGVPKRVVSTFDYRETVDMVSRLYWKLSVNHRILLAPAGSKLQAVGCYLAKALHPDIHVEYPSAKGFKGTYSDKTGKVWMLDLGELSTVVGNMASAERRAHLEVII